MAIGALINNPTATLPPPAPTAPGAWWTWGESDEGQQGLNALTTQTTPVAIGGHLFVKVAAAFKTVAALKSDGTMWVWGRNNHGQLGLGGTVSRDEPEQVTFPVGVTSWTWISVSAKNIVAIDQSGYAWGAGNNTQGQLGTLFGNTTSFQKISLTETFVAIDTGADPANNFNDFCMTAALKSNGEIWGWGSSGFSQSNGSTPSKISTGSDVYTAVQTDGLSVVAIRSGGAMYGRGYNGNGTLGTGDTLDKSVFTISTGGFTYSDFCLGSRCVIALRSNNAAYGWGVNWTNNLAATATPETPSLIASGPYVALTQTKAFQGAVTVLALKSDNSLEAWGANGNYQFGTGSTSGNSSTPVAAGSGNTFNRLSQGTIMYGGGAIKV